MRGYQPARSWPLKMVTHSPPSVSLGPPASGLPGPPSAAPPEPPEPMDPSIGCIDPAAPPAPPAPAAPPELLPVPTPVVPAVPVVVAYVLADPPVPAVTFVPVGPPELPPLPSSLVSPTSRHAARSATEPRKRAPVRDVESIVTTTLLERTSESSGEPSQRDESRVGWFVARDIVNPCPLPRGSAHGEAISFLLATGSSP